MEGASRLLRTTWDQTWHLMERAVARGLSVEEPVASVNCGLDERSAERGKNYITIVSDRHRATVDYNAHERRQTSLNDYFERFTADQFGGIEAVAKHMWEPFVNSVRANLDGADEKIVFERFHIMGYLNRAADSVRTQRNRALVTQGGKTLSGSKYLWLYGAEKLPSKHEGRFAALRSTDLKTGRAWTIKESMRHFWKYVLRGWALRHWDKWSFWATHSLTD